MAEASAATFFSPLAAVIAMIWLSLSFQASAQLATTSLIWLSSWNSFLLRACAHQEAEQ